MLILPKNFCAKLSQESLLLLRGCVIKCAISDVRAGGIASKMLEASFMKARSLDLGQFDAFARAV